MALGSPEANQIVLDIQHLTDHSPILVCLQMGREASNNIWRLSQYWVIPTDLCDHIAASIKEFLQTNEQTTEYTIMWDALKAFIRGEYISHIKRLNVQHRLELAKLKQMVVDLEKAYITTPNENTRIDWQLS
ncbi:hypothetical protein XELAEV_18001988mg [Xenopus laevis]|nr:hypothetical protein XELAEV_18001988mg [Xenopus laevis]